MLRTKNNDHSNVRPESTITGYDFFLPHYSHYFVKNLQISEAMAIRIIIYDTKKRFHPYRSTEADTERLKTQRSEPTRVLFEK